MVLTQKQYEDQWQRIDMNSHSCVPLIFDKDTKNILWGKMVSSTNVSGKSGYLPTESLSPYQYGLRTLISDMKPCS
jgi:hypothetical protein